MDVMVCVDVTEKHQLLKIFFCVTNFIKSILIYLVTTDLVLFQGWITIAQR